MGNKTKILGWMFLRVMAHPVRVHIKCFAVAMVFSLLAIFPMADSGFGAGGVDVSCSSRVAMVPPQVLDPILAEAIAGRVFDYYSAAIKKKYPGKSCSPFLNYQESANELDRVGYSSNFQFDLKKIGAKQVRLISERLNATHLLQVVVNRDDVTDLYSGKNIRFRARVNYYALDLEGGHLEFAGQDRILMVLDPRAQSEIKSTPVSRWLSRVSPNAVSVASGGARFNQNLESRNPANLEVLNTRSKGFLPPLVSSLGLTKIEHPDAYQIFDYSFSLFPSSRILFVHDQITVKRTPKDAASDATDEGTVDDVLIKYTAGCAHGVGQMSLFNPLGTTYAAIGLGPCLISNQSKGGLGGLYLDSSFLVQLGHRFFLNESFFAGVEVEALTFGREIYKDENLTHSSASRGSLLLGYYLSDAEGRFARAWRSISD